MVLWHLGYGCLIQPKINNWFCQQDLFCGSISLCSDEWLCWASRSGKSQQFNAAVEYSAVVEVYLTSENKSSMLAYLNNTFFVCPLRCLAVLTTQ